MIKEQEALLILGKWRDEKTALHIVGRLSDCTLGFDATILGFSEKSIGFEMSGKFDLCELFISGFLFDYAEPRDMESATVSTPTYGARAYSSGLIARRHSGESLVIMEIAA